MRESPFRVAAAILQGLLGLCVGGLGVLGLLDISGAAVPQWDFDGFWFALYAAVGIAEALLALSLARGIPWAYRPSKLLLLLNPVLPLLYIGRAYSQGNLHGSESSLLLLLITLPGSLAALFLLRGRRGPDARP